MKLFSVDKNGKFVQFKEQEFKESNKEIDLEILLENNPDFFFENNKILIIGKQVTTNLNKFIDLLGVDQFGNTVVIELKREKTPRETIAQLIEYASFVDNLDYDQLNEIFQNYMDEEIELENYHTEYFSKSNDSSVISWNKSSKLVIVAQEITPEIKQTALYLRKKGLDIYCLEFKYFISSEKSQIISSDFVIGDESFIRQKVSSGEKFPKTNKETFLSGLDAYGKKIFQRIFEFADKEKLLIKWGAKGFSLNVQNKSEFIGLIFGNPLNSPFKQSIITGFGQIAKKIADSESIVKVFRNGIEQLKLFNLQISFLGYNELKWKIDSVDIDKIEQLIELLKKIVDLIRDKIASTQNDV